MTKIKQFFFVGLLGWSIAIIPVMADEGEMAQIGTARIKDIARFEGVRENMLVGYGLVVGLNGTGDSLSNSPFTEQSLIGMLERLGINIRNDTLNTKNVAAVVVTATLPAFARQGGRIDVSVSALGDATSLLGGTLLVTPLLGADSEVYAVAQGPVVTGAFSAQGEAQNITKNIPTSGRIANGAIVEREICFEFACLDKLRISLRNPDLTTARRIALAINNHVQAAIAAPIDPSTVELQVPCQADIVRLVTDIELLTVQPDTPAKVIVDENSGVIVIGQNVRISTVAIAQGNLTIKITETPQVSQPAPFSSTGTTVTVPRTSIGVNEEITQLGILDGSVTLQDLVTGLNALGVTPRDLISILQNVKASGALQAEIEVR